MTDASIPQNAAPIVIVTNMAASLDAYGALGFAPQQWWAGNDQYVPIARGDAYLHLMVGARANPNHVGGVHVADAFIWVDDLDPIVAAARDAGWAIRRGPERYASTPIATTELVTEDPDGNWICWAVADAVG